MEEMYGAARARSPGIINFKGKITDQHLTLTQCNSITRPEMSLLNDTSINSCFT